MNRRLAYFMLQTEIDSNGNYVPCIAVEGENGYHRTNWQWGNDWDLLNKLCDAMNERLGLSKQEVILIQLQSMRVQS